jgi:hypothetical protein
VGPTVRYGSNVEPDASTLLNEEDAYGSADFGEVGATGILALDTRDRAKHPGSVALRNFGYPRHGVHVAVRGQVFPKALDVEETFGSVRGSAAVYLSPASERTPTLALRAGGQKLFASYPYFEAVPGGGRGFGPSAGDDPVPCFPPHAGDSGLTERRRLRLPISCQAPGVLAFADAGRSVEGEDSNRWHKGYGGGLWFAWLDRANAVSAMFAHSEGRNAVYVHAGFAF